MSNYIKELILQGENVHLDFKFEISDTRKISRSLSAFANTHGGTLLVGVKDNGAIAGIRSEEEYYMLQAAAELHTKPTVHFSAKQWHINGKTILEVTIPKSNDLPHYAKIENDQWVSYIRIHDENRIANSVILKVWNKQKNKDAVLVRYREKEEWLLDYLSQNSTISLSAFCKKAAIPKFLAEKILVNLILLKIIDYQFTSDSVIYKLV
ncbi:MAG: ATP-binding protein [Bacteroidales bacterium]